MSTAPTALDELLATLTLDNLGDEPFGTVLADPPWRFMNRTGKVAPEHKRLSRYDTMTWKEIADMPVGDVMADQSHCYLWVPNALVAEGLRVLEAWGFTYKTMLIWHKVRKDGGSDGRGVGFYFRNVTEPVLFGVRGKLRTLPPGRRQVNLLATQKREHSRKPDELYPIIESCSPGPFLELFARYPQEGWTAWGNEADPETVPRGRQYAAYGGAGQRDIDIDTDLEHANGNGKPPSRVNGRKVTALGAAKNGDSQSSAAGNGTVSTRRVRGATR